MKFLKLLAEATIDAGSAGIPMATDVSVWEGALNVVYFVAGAVCVVVIIIAGYFYVVSTGNPQAIAKAKNTILYAIIGIVIVMIAFVVTRFIIGRF